MQSVVGVAMVPEAILEKLEPMLRSSEIAVGSGLFMNKTSEYGMKSTHLR